MLRFTLLRTVLLGSFSLVLPVQLASTVAHAEDAVVADKPTAKGSAKKNGSATKFVEPQVLKLADGKLLLPVPGNWKVVKPRNRIIYHEFAIAPAKSDDAPGRMTIMPSGGGIKANIARWEGQFKSSDGKPLGDEAKKIEKKEIGGQTVHVVDLSGTFIDSVGGPFSGKKIDRPNYRMLAAIVPLEEGGTWFIKSYGPKATMSVAQKDFEKMIAGIKLAK